MRTNKLPRVLSFRKAKKIVQGILFYGNVQSRSRGTRLIHNVIVAKSGSKLLSKCSCEWASFHVRPNAVKPCIHRLAIQNKMRRLGIRGAGGVA
jgi:hypothetical protein